MTHPRILTEHELEELEDLNKAYSTRHTMQSNGHVYYLCSCGVTHQNGEDSLCTYCTNRLAELLQE